MKFGANSCRNTMTELAVYVTLLVLWRYGSDGHKVVVETDKGEVEGRSHFVHGRSIEIFLGIPYARPPIGDLRFLHPEQIDPWPGVWDATRKRNSCMQVPDTYFGNFSGATVWNTDSEVSEDCLYLNVWAPAGKSESGKAVLVWVFGGAFLNGASTLDVYDAKYLAAENDVIVVSMDFRFGALGYLSLGYPESPGNAGIMDLRMSLEWIQRNIHKFGGDVHNITLMGESSGAASIGLLMLSSIGRGFFHRAILQSGSPQAPWATSSFAEGRRRSLALARKMGCNTKTSNAEILRCLRKIPAIDFPMNETSIVSGLATFPFIPVIDGSFLTKSPTEYMKEGLFKKIPLLLGSNANEGSWLLFYSEPNHFNLDSASRLNAKNYKDVMGRLFAYYPQYPQKLDYLGVDAVAYQYRNWLSPHDHVQMSKSVEKAVGDYHFTCGVVDMAKALSSHGKNVYVYSFNHRYSVNPWPKWSGVLHGDEIFFVFGRPLVRGLGFTNAEKRLSRKIMRMWTNFAKTGNPNNSPGGLKKKFWPEYRSRDQRYLEIDLHLLDGTPTVKTGLRPEKCAFWKHYLPKLASLAPSNIYSNCSLLAAMSSAARSRASIWSSLFLLLTYSLLKHFCTKTVC